ncbi:hypothetical protein [Shewanella sediminis]|nr:hypothetical protein [Shewanella sediminis]
MSKLKPDVNVIHSGIFTKWNDQSDKLPNTNCTKYLTIQRELKAL